MGTSVSPCPRDKPGEQRGGVREPRAALEPLVRGLRVQQPVVVELGHGPERVRNAEHDLPHKQVVSPDLPRRRRGAGAYTRALLSSS